MTPDKRAAATAKLKAHCAQPHIRAARRAAALNQNARWLATGCRYSVPESVHPIVRGIFHAINKSGRTRPAVGDAAGVASATMNCWRTKSAPNLLNADAVLNELGLELAIVRRGRRDDYGFAARPIELSARRE